MKSRIRLLAILVILFLLSGCGAPATSHRLVFRAPMQVNSDGEFHVSLEVHNAGDGAFAGDDECDAEMHIVDATTSSERAEMWIGSLPAVKPTDSAFPATWRGRLDPGEYTLTWGAEGYGKVLVEFCVVKRDGRIHLQDESSSFEEASLDTSAPTNPQPTTRTEAEPPAQFRSERVSVTSVRVSDGREVEFSGYSSLPDGATVQTQLSANGEIVDWWPADQAAVVQDEQWSICVTLHDGDTSTLDSNASYELRAWETGNPAISSVPFPFDLAGPASPPTG